MSNGNYVSNFILSKLICILIRKSDPEAILLYKFCKRCAAWNKKGLFPDKGQRNKKVTFFGNNNLLEFCMRFFTLEKFSETTFFIKLKTVLSCELDLILLCFKGHHCNI